MVIELYRNNLFNPMDIGNFAPIFAYRNTFFQLNNISISIQLGHCRLRDHLGSILLMEHDGKHPNSELSINSKEKELLLLHPGGLMLSNLSFRAVSMICITTATLLIHNELPFRNQTKRNRY